MDSLLNTSSDQLMITKHQKQATIPSPAMTSESGQRAASEKEQVVPCPRCHSRETKFCYYNNYNLSQPRHFCKSCRRYWRRGGSLRDVPVGGATRKTSSSNNNKRRRATTNSNNDNNEVRCQTTDQTRPVYPDSAACDESSGQMGCGLFPLSEYGLDWADGPMSVGDGSKVDTWQMVEEGDYFSWPELAMSTPPKALK